MALTGGVQVPPLRHHENSTSKIAGLKVDTVCIGTSFGPSGTKHGDEMRTENLIAVANMRSREIQTSILPYVAIHAVVLLSIVFGGSGLEADGVKLALAAFAVLGSIWIAMGVDGAIADIGAAAKDMDEEMAASHMGQNWAKAPFGIFRVITALFTALLLVAELIALYS